MNVWVWIKCNIKREDNVFYLLLFWKGDNKVFLWLHYTLNNQLFLFFFQFVPRSVSNAEIHPQVVLNATGSIEEHRQPAIAVQAISKHNRAAKVHEKDQIKVSPFKFIITFSLYFWVSAPPPKIYFVSECEFPCSTCVNTSTTCLECVGSYRNPPPDCHCLPGYLEAGLPNCTSNYNQCLRIFCFFLCIY